MTSNTKKFVLAGLMTALVFIMTFIIKIPVPYTSGYIHFGDSMIYISVLILGPIYGAFASGIGSMLADIVGGYAQFALPTLIIKSLMALIMGLVLSKKTQRSTILSVVSAITIWSAFLAGVMLFLRTQIQSIGQEKIVHLISGVDADADTISDTAAALNKLPVYLMAGIAVLLLVLSLSAYFILKRQGIEIFSIKAMIGMTMAGMLMVMGYFIVESFMYTPIAAIFSIPMNMIQFFGGVVAASLFAPAIKKAGISIQ